jgi:hypothetical protein
MGIFQRLKGKSATPAPVTDKKATAKKPAEAKKADAKPAEEHKVIAPKIKAAKFAYLLVSPRVSEKAAAPVRSSAADAHPASAPIGKKLSSRSRPVRRSTCMKASKPYAY